MKGIKKQDMLLRLAFLESSKVTKEYVLEKQYAIFDAKIALFLLDWLKDTPDSVLERLIRNDTDSR
jgi:hypothetical protein